MTYDETMADDWGAVAREFARRIKLLRAAGYRQTGGARTLEDNRGARGKGRSQHLIGTAADFGSRELSPAQVAAFKAKARELDLVVVDERARPGYPPHLHVQGFVKGTIPDRIYTQLGVQIREEP